MSRFSRIDTSFGSSPSFTYTDIDGDELKVWAYDEGTLRMEPSSPNGIAIVPEDLPEFKRQIARVTRKKCQNCDGEGYVP